MLLVSSSSDALTLFLAVIACIGGIGMLYCLCSFMMGLGQIDDMYMSGIPPSDSKSKKQEEEPKEEE